MSERREANFENRIYFFVIKNNAAAEITIDMYGTVYTLVKKGNEWVNADSNRMNLAPGLLNEVVKVVQGS